MGLPFLQVSQINQTAEMSQNNTKSEKDVRILFE